MMIYSIDQSTFDSKYCNCSISSLCSVNRKEQQIFSIENVNVSQLLFISERFVGMYSSLLLKPSKST